MNRLFTLLIVAFMLPGFPANAQKQSKKVVITGNVVTEEGAPVQGATIFIDGVETNSKTNRLGDFRMKIDPDADRIAAIKPDIGIAEELIGEKTVFNLKLNKARIIQLLEMGHEDEMVDIGYGFIKRSNLTTSSSTIKTENVRFRSYTNIYDMIKGEVPGVEVNGNSIRIRGISSINLSNEPLFVVDGVPTSTISDIPPTQVESIQVLKGADASMYGSRGANGVILIRRKK